MKEPLSHKEGKKKALKRLIKSLHTSHNPEKVKEKFKEILKDTTPTDIAEVEDELIKEGMPLEEVHKLCDVHLAVFRESLEKEKVLAPPGHPIHILMEEHRILLDSAGQLREATQKLEGAKDVGAAWPQMGQIRRIEQHVKDSDNHYLREENVLFPTLEKHGITQPPAIMWMEHDKIREIKKALYKLIDTAKALAFNDFARQIDEAARSLAETLSSHFYKENNILFTAALRVITEDEWEGIRRQFDELGYCSFTPEPARAAFGEPERAVSKPEAAGMVSFDSGAFSREELEALLNTLPVDITFVGKDDTVRYFSQSKDRIFTRTKAIIGRKVQQCHPQKSLHVVEQILKDFKSGRLDSAEFWINLQGKMVLIRYFAVRRDGNYLGCLEVTQDITEIQKIKGEKRLL